MKPNLKPELKKINEMKTSKLTILLLLALGVMLMEQAVNGQHLPTDFHFDGIGWTNYLGNPASGPGPGTQANTYYVDGGPCTIVNADIDSLIINNIADGTICSITGIVNAKSVIVTTYESDTNIPTLQVDNTLNITGISGGIPSFTDGTLNVGCVLNGSGTVNLYGDKNSTQTIDQNGSITISNLNIQSGIVSFASMFDINNLNIGVNASVTILAHNSDERFPRISGLLTLDGHLTNNYFYSQGIFRDYFVVSNLSINSGGVFTSTSGKCNFTSSISIGGTITHAVLSDNYLMDFTNPGTTRTLNIFGNAQVNISDITPANTTKNIGQLNISDNAKFIVDRGLSVKTLTLNLGGSLIASGSPTIKITNPISSIDGKLLLTAGTSFTNTISSLSLTGTNSAISYLNRPSLVVTLNATKDSIYNCSFQQVISNSGKTGIINNPSASYKITQIDAADSLRVYSLQRNDILNIGATGKVKLKGYTLVNQKIDITAGGSLTSSGNLTMADGSTLFFPNTGQVIGAINWQRRYGGLGWQYFGPTASGTNKTNIKGRISSTLYLNKYDESLSTKRWVAMDNSNFVRGRGYELGITPTAPQILNDTLVFNGVAAVDTVIVTGLTYTTTNGSYQDSQRGYNLVSNPYTAPIDVATFFSANTMLSAIYYWDDSGAGVGTFVARSNDAVPIYTPSTIPGSNSTRITKTYLAPNQGFFVKILPGRDSVVFRKDQIVHQLNDNYLKDIVIPNNKPNFIRLEVENNSGTKNDCVIKFSDLGSDSINKQLDIYKLTSGTFPVEIYSFKGLEQLAIQTRKGVSDEVSIPIGLLVKKNEPHVFSMNNFDCLPTNINVYFIDDTLKQTANLREASYIVTLPSKTINNRFRLVLKSGTIPTFSNFKIDNASNINIYSNSGKIYADFYQEMNDVNINITDISGRIVYQQNFANIQGKEELNGSFAMNNVYIIKITGKNFSKVNKLVIQ